MLFSLNLIILIGGRIMSVLSVVSAIKLYELSILRESIHELSQRCHKINKFPKSRAGGINKRAAGFE